MKGSSLLNHVQSHSLNLVMARLCRLCMVTATAAFIPSVARLAAILEESLCFTLLRPCLCVCFWRSDASSDCSCTGKPVAFKLIPQGGPTLLAKPFSLIAKRGLFATKHLWVTPHKEEERYAAGDWVLQAKGGDGLEEWVKQVWDFSIP